jgi:uncharacterized membrane protein YfcA
MLLKNGGNSKNCAMDWNLQAELLVIGLLSGVLGGLLGIGGGIIFVTILPAVLLKMGIPESEIVEFTVANSLFATFFTTLSGNIRGAFYYKTDWRPILWLSGGSIVISILLLHFFVNTPYYSRTAFNGLFLCVVAYMMYLLYKKSKNDKIQPPEEEKKKTPPIKKLLLTGLAAGVISPLTGLGGGLMIVPVLHSRLGYSMRQANFISLGCIGITAFFSTLWNMSESTLVQISHWQSGYIVFPVCLYLGAGGVVGAFLGVDLNRKIAPPLIRVLFGVTLFFIFVRKILELL